MRLGILAAIPAALFIASALGCSGAPGSEANDTVSSASSTGGVTATITVNHQDSQFVYATGTVQNQSAEPVTNWQVAVNLGQANLYQGTNGAEVNVINGQAVFNPGPNAQTIQPGGSVNFTFSTQITGSNHTPAVATVDGVAPGTAGAGNPADGIDHIARAAATGALVLAQAYEKDKPANNGDKNYALYDRLIWSSNSFRLASGNMTIEFDPSAPGYAFVPGSAKTALAAIQMDPSVASYLTTGLASCFSDVKGDWAYAFRADFLKGFTYPTKFSGKATNADGSTDNYTVVGAPANGAAQVTITATSTTDNYFGILTYQPMSTFPGYKPSQYTGQYTASCSPFNGPGGTANPYLVITQNNQPVVARYQGIGTVCNNGCTGTMVADPVPYAEPGQYYDTSGNLVGMQSNPFALDITVLYAVPDHATQWATRTANSTQQWGTFSNAVQILGYTEYKYAKQY